MNAVNPLPVDAAQATLVGRVWLLGPHAGPGTVVVKDGMVFDISAHAPTMADLLDHEDCAGFARGLAGKPLCPLDQLIRDSLHRTPEKPVPVLCAPCDVQAVKASGVTFIVSLLERLIEERAGGDAQKAQAIRDALQQTIGAELTSVRPGSESARQLKQELVRRGEWSQYLEVAIGPDAEIFSKALPMASVGLGERIGLHPDSRWNNPEPEIVLAMDSRGRPRGATLGNDVNLRDIEGRSALLLGRAKDNNGSCASRARKSSAGYDLTRLFVSSEGTLGVIVEATLRVYPRPEAVTAAVCSFPDLADAVRAVVDIMQSGIAIARIEFMDQRAVRAVNRHSRLGLPETPLLLFEFHGSASGVQEQAGIVREITGDHGGSGFDWAEKPEDRARLWAARHQSHFAGLQLRPGARSIATDVCVPISRLVDCVTQTVADLESVDFPYTIVGHVGDGNFHVQMLIDPDSPTEWQEAESINRSLVHRAIGMEGTCSGEHGVGIHKMEFLQAEHGAAGLELMRVLKHAYDPHNIFNPGKVVAWDAQS